ncbi:MAG: hypothetical protein EA392_01885 [Cryomorphaceae bacterium]|nr:MAG: hypothetical protein EA392_01885 [Cryomorphaceae bacterium]
MNKWISFAGGVVLGLLALWLIMPPQPEEVYYLEFTDNAIALRLKNASDAEVQAYMDQVAAADLPSNYVLPAYISGSPNLTAAVNNVNDRYARFSRVKGSEHLQAVREDPIGYRSYIQAHKAMEKYFIYLDSMKESE